MNWLSNLLLMTVVLGLLSSCAGLSNDQKQSHETAESVEPIVIRVSGYGAYANEKDRLSERKRLMVMRTSRLDAYRALAERVYGTVIFGSSTVKDFVMQDDNYRTLIDSVVRGGRVVNVTEHKSGTFETVVELILEPGFRECLTRVNYFRYSEECRLPLPQGRDPAVDVQASSKREDSLYYLK